MSELRGSVAWSRIALVVGALAAIVPLSAQAGGRSAPLTVAQVDRMTPVCDGHPERHWIGSVVGAIDARNGGGVPVSFVGCFTDRHSCEVWKQEAGGLVNGFLTQYSCDPRY